MTSTTPNDLSFEKAFQKLGQAVQALERGGLSLDQALTVYEEGMRLAQACTLHLDSAELKITELQNTFLAVGSAPEFENGHGR